MTPKTATLGLLLLFVSMVMAQAPSSEEHKTTPHVCHLVSADSPESNPFQSVPKNSDFTRLNRFPKVSYVVNENGNVSGVKILKGTGSAKVDASLVKSIQAWRYKPQPGCTFEMSTVVVIDFGS
jgi:TonB family protein